MGAEVRPERPYDGRRTAQRAAFAVGLLALYVVADLLLRPSLIGVNRIMPWYPGAGLGIGLLAVAGLRWAPAVVGARILLYAWDDPSRLLDPAWIGVRIPEAIAIVVAYAIAATIVRRRVVGGLGAWRLQHGAWLCGAILVGALLAATAFALRAIWEYHDELATLFRFLSLFAAGDATGSLVVLPVVLTSYGRLFRVAPGWSAAEADLGTPPLPATGGKATANASAAGDGVVARPTMAERAAQVAAVGAAAAIATASIAMGQFDHPGVRLVLLAVLVWLSIRSGIAGASAVLASYGLVCLGTAAAGYVARDAVPGIQATLLTLGIVGVLLGTLRTEAVAHAARYWQFLAGSGEGVWRADADGCTVYANARMLQLLGRPAADVLGVPTRDFVVPDDRAAWDAAWAAPGDDDDVVHEARLVRADGTTAVVLVRGRVVRDAGGATVGTVALVSDVTSLRAAEASGQRAQTLFEAAFRSSRDAMLLVHVGDGRVMDTNDVWCALTGRRREDVIGRPHAELGVLSPEDERRFVAAVREHGEVRDFEVAFDRHVGGAPAEDGHAVLSGYPVSVEGATYLLVIGRDITVERRREHAELQLRRLEDLGRLAGSVSHDFNNLLTVVLAYAQIARSAKAAGERVLISDLEEIERAALRGQELTRRLLAFSRNQAVEPQVVDLGAAVSAARGMMSSVLGLATLHVECAAPPPSIVADPSQIDQVLLNLAVNARDAMPDGGTVTVTVDRVEVAPGEASTFVGADALPGPYARLRFADTGVGMDEATRSRVFEPFFTTKREGTGTGLGLAVVFGIVRQARGGIHVESAPGRGTTFTLVWPIARAGASARLPIVRAVSAVPESAARRRRVLVAEDDATVARIVRRLLDGAGYDVHVASDGRVALALLEELTATGQPPDVVLSDVMMPGMGGRALAARLAEQRPGLPVILMSGHTGDADVREGLPNVPVAVLAKPFDVAALRAAVATALETRGAAATSV